MIAPTPLELAKLEQGNPGMTPTWGASLAEAAGVSLEAQGHAGPTSFSVEGIVTHLHRLTWSPIDDQARRCWNDLTEAAEHGAYGVAALLVAEHTPLEVVERSAKGTGFDYWLGEKGQTDFLFQRKARLEVSGIQRGSDTVITTRVKGKLRQTARSAGILPALVVVVEFGSPLARVAAA